jgi:hypothetical protein
MPLLTNDDETSFVFAEIGIFLEYSPQKGFFISRPFGVFAIKLKLFTVV